MKKTGFKRYVYDFSIDYDAIAIDDILDIHNFLIKKEKRKYDIKIMFGFIKKVFFIGSTILSTLSSVNLLECVRIY